MLETAELARQGSVPIYLVLTMRSDYLGDCAVFAGLPEALNESQYLTPRLTRDQRREAIESPARVHYGRVDPVLVNRLLNDTSGAADALPLMQHALMRMWSLARERSGVTGSDPTGEEVTITEADYRQVGGLSGAISRDVERVYSDLDAPGRRIARILFCRLCEVDEGPGDIRRPTELAKVADVAGVPVDAVRSVADAFRDPAFRFLAPSIDELRQLQDDTRLDITHESLIREWRRLRRWLKRERDSAEAYRRLARTAIDWEDRHAALWGSPDLENFLEWERRESPTEAWADRYGGRFALAMQFLRKSEAKRRKDRLRATWRRIAWILGGALSLLVVAYFNYQNRVAFLQKRLSDQRIAEERQSRERMDRLARSYKTLLNFYPIDKHPRSSLSRAILAAGPFLNVADPDDGEFRAKLSEVLAKVGGRSIHDPGEVVHSMATSPDYRWLITTSTDGTIRLRDLAGVPTDKPSGPFGGGEVAIGPTVVPPRPAEAGSPVRAEPEATPGRIVTMSGTTEYHARIWDFRLGVRSPVPIALPGDRPGHRPGVALSDDGRWLASVRSDGRAARVWDLSAADPTRKPIDLEGEWQGELLGLAFADHGSRLVAVLKNAIALVWDLSHPGKPALMELRDPKDRFPDDTALTADGRWLAVSNLPDRSGRIYDLKAPGAPPIVLSGLDEPIIACAYQETSRERRLATNGGRYVRVWVRGPKDRESRAAAPLVGLRLEAHEGRVLQVAISPGGEWLASAGDDLTVRLWDLKAADQLAMIAPIAPARAPIIRAARLGRAAIKPRLAMAAFGIDRDGMQRAESPSHASQLRPRMVLRWHDQAVVQIVFGPIDPGTHSSRWMVTLDGGGSAHLWDLTAAAPASSLPDTLEGLVDVARERLGPMPGEEQLVGSSDSAATDQGEPGQGPAPGGSDPSVKPVENPPRGGLPLDSPTLTARVVEGTRPRWAQPVARGAQTIDPAVRMNLGTIRMSAARQKAERSPKFGPRNRITPLILAGSGIHTAETGRFQSCLFFTCHSGLDLLSKIYGREGRSRHTSSDPGRLARDCEHRRHGREENQLRCDDNALLARSDRAPQPRQFCERGLGQI